MLRVWAAIAASVAIGGLVASVTVRSDDPVTVPTIELPVEPKPEPTPVVAGVVALRPELLGAVADDDERLDDGEPERQEPDDPATAEPDPEELGDEDDRDSDGEQDGDDDD